MTSLKHGNQTLAFRPTPNARTLGRSLGIARPSLYQPFPGPCPSTLEASLYPHLGNRNRLAHTRSAGLLRFPSRASSLALNPRIAGGGGKLIPISKNPTGPPDGSRFRLRRLLNHLLRLTP